MTLRLSPAFYFRRYSFLNPSQLDSIQLSLLHTQIYHQYVLIFCVPESFLLQLEILVSCHFPYGFKRSQSNRSPGAAFLKNTDEVIFFRLTASYSHLYWSGQQDESKTTCMLGSDLILDYLGPSQCPQKDWRVRKLI